MKTCLREDLKSKYMEMTQEEMIHGVERDVPNSKGRQWQRKLQVSVSVEKGLSGHHHEELSVQKGANLWLCPFGVRLPSFHIFSLLIYT